jgi:L-asparaginase II
MTTNPVMVSGPGRFDTRLMEVSGGTVVCKGGAEGYQALGLAANALKPGSPAMGITYKVIDGDPTGRARAVVAVALLQQLGALNEDQVRELAEFGARPLYNWRHIEIGEIRPAFHIERP